MKQFIYTGTELELFAAAKNWKNYIRTILRQYIKGTVLEVGAGIGSNTQLLHHHRLSQWLCLEPDPRLFKTLAYVIQSNGIGHCSAYNGTIDCLNTNQLFDSILYIDVLEHIRDDHQELRNVSRHLNVQGNLIILAPAYQWLFTPFDAAIGHYRRYDKKMLRNILPDNIRVVKLSYLDCAGLLASLANKLLLKQSYPTLKQVKIWDTFLVPLSKLLDPVLGYTFGKSILLVGKKMFNE